MPSYTLARVAGGIFVWVFKKRNNGREGNIIILASGMILGESIASLVSLVLTAAQAPKLGSK
jgi:uncharacterized oligopeptide transporter (OPT) family protein